MCDWAQSNNLVTDLPYIIQVELGNSDISDSLTRYGMMILSFPLVKYQNQPVGSSTLITYIHFNSEVPSFRWDVNASIIAMVILNVQSVSIMGNYPTYLHQILYDSIISCSNSAIPNTIHVKMNKDRKYC